MPLTPKEAFKTGFLARCEEEGLSSEGIEGRIKSAQDLCVDSLIPSTPEEEEFLKLAGPGLLGGIAGAAGKGLGGLVDIIKSSPWYAMGIGGVGGAALGTLGGNMRNAFDPEVSRHTTPEEVQDVQAAELIQSLNRESAAARRRAVMLKKKREREEADASRWSRI